MKKFLCLFLTVAMVVSLCGCFGDNDADDVRGEIVNGNSSQISSQNNIQDDSQNDKEPELSLGTTANNTYKNDFLGLSCTLPSKWVFYTDEQILEINNIVKDVVDEEVVELLKNANIIYDMYAANETDGSNINVNLEKLSAAQMINLNIKQVLEAQIDAIKSGVEDLGCTDINVGYQKINIGGKEFDALKLSAKIQGVNYYSTVFTFKKGNYLANVTISSLQTDKTDTIKNYFTIK